MCRYIIKKPSSTADITQHPTPANVTYNTKKITKNNNNDSIMSSSDENEAKTDTSSSKRKRYYTQHFKESWKKEFKWAVSNTDGVSATCIVCNIVIKGSVSHLKRHDCSETHKKKFKAAEQTPSVKKVFDSTPEKSTNNLVKEAELKLVAFLAEHNLPFNLIDHFVLMCSSAFPDSKIAKNITMKRKKATQIATNVIGPTNKEYLISDLRKEYFSLIIDETTDISSSKCLALIARYCKNDRILDRFFDLIELESASAKSIFDNIKYALEKHNIPLANVIGLGADNCSVMMGNLNGVKALFREINPNIVTIGCSCHSMHLCASYAGEKLPRSIEQFTRDIYNYFQNSSKRLLELRECQIFAQEKPQNILRPSQTRWLSLQQVVTRILQHWSSLELFFTRAALEDNMQRAQLILDSLHNPIYKVYFYFLSYILEVTNKLNLEFQAETPKIQVLLARVTSLYKVILKSFLKKSYLEKTDLKDIVVSNPNNYVLLDDLYCGANVENFLKNNQNQTDPIEIKNFKLRVLEYYIELAKQIKKRFNFEDDILKFASKFSPRSVLTGEYNTISQVQDLFPYLTIDIEKLDFEYRLISEMNELKKYDDNDMVQFWSCIANINSELNEKMFPNVSRVAKIIMSLPHSSATAERVFSQLNLVKTKTRNRLIVKTCGSLLHIKDMFKTEGTTCFNWQPSLRMINYSNGLLMSSDIPEEDIILN